MRNDVLTLLLTVLGTWSRLLVADEGLTARGLAVESRNNAPSFMVRVSVDHADCRYRIGEEMIVQVRSERAGFLYLFYINAEDQVSIVFPNDRQQDNRIQAGEDVVIPAENAEFRFRVTAPAGDEVLKAVVSEQRLQHLDAIGLTRTACTGVTAQQFRQSETRLQNQPAAAWAEHSLPVRVIEANDVTTPPRKRHLISVGVSVFGDSSIPELRTAHKDAQEFTQLMQRKGGVTTVRELTNEAATMAAVESAFTEEASRLTMPGDEVFVYWSGHGALISDVNGDEQDGYDECLLLHDTSRESLASLQQSMLSDDRFGRWIQKLDGRSVVLIIDACHSGGQSALEKSVGAASRNEFQFLDNELVRAKDIGQPNIAMITSSQADQLSFERPDGSFSVMTGLMLEQMASAERLSLDEMWEYLKDSVPNYVTQNIPGAQKQSPRYFRQLSHRIMLIGQ